MNKFAAYEVQPLIRQGSYHAPLQFLCCIIEDPVINTLNLLILGQNTKVSKG